MEENKENLTPQQDAEPVEKVDIINAEIHQVATPPKPEKHWWSIFTRQRELKHPVAIAVVILALAIVAEIFLGCQGAQNVIRIQENTKKIESLEKTYNDLKVQKTQLRMQKKVDLMRALGGKAKPVARSLNYIEGSPDYSIQKLPATKDGPISVRVVGADDPAKVKMRAAADELTKAQNLYVKGTLSSDEVKMISEHIDQYFGTQDKVNRVPWYYGEDMVSWEFIEPLLDNRETYPVFWLARNAGGEMAALCTATWDTLSEQFVHVAYGFVGSNGAPVEVQEPDVDEGEGIVNE